ncbi:MAG: M48 family metallopeptidase [Sphingomonadaceae bacterium]
MKTIDCDEDHEGSLESDEGWQRKARDFARARLRLHGARTALCLLFPFLFWRLGGSAALADALPAPAGPGWLAAPAFLLAYQAIVVLLFLPFSWYGGFHLQHRFGLSRQDLRGWLADWAKATLLGTLFFVAGFGAFYLAIHLLPNDWWWVLATGLSLVALLLTFVAPVLLLPLFYKCSPLEDRELAERIERLADRVGAHVSKVCAIDLSRRTVAANAALAGIGRTRQVLLGDTMLRQFSRDEVETVVAHELGHHVHGDIWKGLLLEIGGIWVGLFLLQEAVRPLFLAGGIGDISVPANLPLLIVLGEVASIALMPLANAFSRHREALADRFAVRTSGMPEAYASAMYRLAKQNLAELWPPRWVELLFYTHPAAGRRIARARRTG